jgi:hypothetical protein
MLTDVYGMPLIDDEYYVVLVVCVDPESETEEIVKIYNSGRGKVTPYMYDLIKFNHIGMALRIHRIFDDCMMLK